MHLQNIWIGKYTNTGKLVRYKSYMESLQILYTIPMQILYRKWETWN
jgi:roadblock/LC7 domain-containing protein